MARDYKYRAQAKQTEPQKPVIPGWKWFVILVLISVFVGFLYFLHRQAQTPPKPSATQLSINQTARDTTQPKAPPPKPQKKKAEEPHYDFYTLLPKAEIEVADHEIKTRSREERIGKAKTTHYIIQVGSFRDFKEADRLRARLALIGIESRIEKTQIGNALWNRVKMGPFQNPTNVAKIKTQLRQNGIDAIVTEQEG